MLQESKGELWNRPLHLAAASGQLHVVKVLLRHKCRLVSSELHREAANLVVAAAHAASRFLNSCLQEARNALGNNPLQIAKPHCKAVMNFVLKGGEAAYQELVADLDREAAELAARLEEGRRAQEER